MRPLNLYERKYYPESFKYNEFMLKVSGLHEIYVSEYGNPKGIPVIKFHGGPGAFSRPKHTKIFNPFKYRIIIYDQRGCGKSIPSGELKENTTQDLIEDIEKIRNHLKIDRWSIHGGSWGSTLALAYAQKHPSVIKDMILVGIYTARNRETDWVYKQVYKFYPDVYEKFMEPVPKEYHADPLKFYSKEILNNSNPDHDLIRRFCYLEANIVKLYPEASNLNLDYEVMKEQIDSVKIFLHYDSNSSFLEEGELLKIENIDKIRHIPAVIIQGRYDMVCPMETAWELHKQWPEADFEVIADAGHHTSSEPGIVDATIKWTDKFAG